MARRKTSRRKETPRFAEPVYFKNKAGRWMAIHPGIGTRPAAKPTTVYRQRRRDGRGGFVYPLVNPKTGHLLPQGAAVPRDGDRWKTIISKMRRHLRSATGFGWNASYEHPKWWGWHSEYHFAPSAGDKNSATWRQMGKAFLEMRRDRSLLKLFDGPPPEVLHFGFDHSIDGTPKKLMKDGSGRANRDYQALVTRSEAEAAFDRGWRKMAKPTAVEPKSWAMRYKQARIFGVIMRAVRAGETRRGSFTPLEGKFNIPGPGGELTWREKARLSRKARK